MNTINKIKNFNEFNNSLTESVDELLANRIDIQTLIQKLKIAYAEEVRAFYQYFVAIPFIIGNERKFIEDFFTITAEDELNDHAKRLLNRIEQLGGDASLVDNFDTLKDIAECPYIVPSAPYRAGKLLDDNIITEKEAIKRYIDICDFCRGKDDVTYQLVKDILADEQEHLQELINFKNDITQNE